MKLHTKCISKLFDGREIHQDPQTKRQYEFNPGKILKETKPGKYEWVETQSQIRCLKDYEYVKT